MRNAEMINLVFFSGLSILACLQSLPALLRNRCLLLGLSGIAVSMAAFLSSRVLPPEASDILRDWTPAPLMVMAYWQSGCFFHRPDASLQKTFESWDARVFRALGMTPSSSWDRSWFGSALELAYLICYPVVPLGVAALYVAGMRDRVDDYWLVVLLSAYACYAMLPFIQLHPPRTLEAGRERSISNGVLRRLNLWIVGKATHQATTFPSGHVAASTAIALVLLRETPAIGLLFLAIAAGIAMGCVSVRYHYAVDVIAAVILASIVFAVVTLQ
jgi:membrane-associated phospholipid phosphatase